MTSANFVEIVKSGGNILENCEGFFCYNLEYNFYTEFVSDTFEKRDIFKSEGKVLLQNLAKNFGLSVYGGNNRRNINKEFISVTETWMREIFDDRFEEWFSLKNGNLIVILEENEGVDDYANAKLVNTRPSHCGSYFLSHSRRLMNDVINQIGGFYNNSFCYTDTNSLYIHKKFGSDLVDNRLVGKSLGLSKNDCGILG